MSAALIGGAIISFVSSGSITLDRSASTVLVGLGYTGTIRGLNIEAGSQLGTAMGKTQRIYAATVKIYKSLGFKIGTTEQMDIVPFRDSSMSMDEPPTLFTGDKRVAFPKGWDRESYVIIKQEQPLPLTVLAIVAQMNTIDA